MALYTILFGVSIFLIALVSAIIKKMFFHWKEEHKIETMMVPTYMEHPTVSVIIILDKCVIRRRKFAENLSVYDIISKSDMSLTKEDDPDHPDAQPSHTLEQAEARPIETELATEKSTEKS
ncbi:uncharacterized protein LOC125239070 [Leguminivora glycinivorella]|uniref:uncharacterized protein LOC125239070 n=1 Tax=Leguminivora glycinivorella TaxID=1035111 RepID=UPI00200C3812|nr:uncharacterized protein LOC125239070 [Leguminivora glycinivorella]